MNFAHGNLVDAIIDNNFALVRHLIVINNVPIDDGAPLAIAVSRSRTDMASYLLARGANANKVDSFNTSPLHYAARTNGGIIMKELLKAGAKANARDKGGVAPLHLAALYGWPDCVASLLQGGGDPMAATMLGITPIDLCLGSILRRTKGLFDSSTELDYIKRFVFEKRAMTTLLSSPIDRKVLLMAGKSDIKRLQRCLAMLIDARRDFQALNNTLSFR
mgnify:CR=1 FL=1